jgi:hypothetical protein
MVRRVRAELRRAYRNGLVKMLEVEEVGGVM